MNKIKFDLDDVALVPAFQSDIESRQDCDPIAFPPHYGYFDKGFLPLITAPMDTVVDDKNWLEYIGNGINVCMPRNKEINDTFIDNIYTNVVFHSVGLREFEVMMIDHDEFLERYAAICLDIANGHMSKISTIIEKYQSMFPRNKLIVGNIANPDTYKILAKSGAYAVRLGVGMGNACTTAANIGVYYPMGSLITECREIKDYNGYETKIIADGGMKGYSDVIRALALGSDQIMIGSLFNKALESSGQDYFMKFKINRQIADSFYKMRFPITKKFRGMSTKEVQREWGKSKIKTSEGVIRYRKVEYTLSQWVENFTDYLRSAMSYCGAKNLDEFIGKVDYIQITENSRKRFQK